MPLYKCDICLGSGIWMKLTCSSCDGRGYIKAQVKMVKKKEGPGWDDERY